MEDFIKIPNYKVLIWARMDEGISEKEVAELLNMSLETFEAFEQPGSKMPINTLTMLAYIYKRSIATLLLHQVPCRQRFNIDEVIVTDTNGNKKVFKEIES